MLWRAFIVLAICVPAYFVAAEPALAHAGHAHHAAPSHAAAQPAAKSGKQAAAIRSDLTMFVTAHHGAPAPAAPDACGAQCCVCSGASHNAMSLLSAGFDAVDKSGRAPLEIAHAPFRTFGPPDRYDPPPRSFI